jgi:hypothetical protein
VTLGGVVLALEPAGPAVAVAIAAASVIVASAASLFLLRWSVAGRSARARSSRARALRRGLEVGAVVGLIAALQVVGGLTPLTALFVVLSFAIAEYVLSAGPSTAR